MPVHPELIHIATRQQVLLEQLKSGHVRDFLGVFKDVDKQLLKAIKELSVDTLNELRRPQLEALIKELTTIQANLFSEKINSFVDSSGDVAEYVAELESKVIKSVATKKQSKDIVTPDAPTLNKAVLKRPIQATGDLLADFVDRWSVSSIQRVNAAVRIAYEQGKTVQQTVRDLFGTPSLRYKDGVEAISKRQAASVVRTAVQHMASTARVMTYEENNDVVEGYVWVSTLDGHTTPECRALDGKQFEVGSGPLPPIHINCRSTTTPSLIKEFKFLNKEATRSSMDGYVPADQTYYEWLKEQNEEFQDHVLGPTRGQLFRDGGLSVERFRDLQLDKNFDPITLDEMRKLEPLAFKKAGI